MSAIIVTVIFILFDILTGVIKAVYKGELNSTILREGMFHKLSEVIALLGSKLLEYAPAYVNLGVDLPVVGIVSVYICVMELISCIENLSVVNPELAKMFEPYLKKLKDDKTEE